MSKKIFFLFWFLIFIFFYAVFPVSSNATESFKKMRLLIRDELFYPKEARYTLPATLPSMRHTAKQNEVFLKIAQKLEDLSVLTFSPTFNGILLKPISGTSDVVSQEINLNYELLALHLILGTWDIQIKEIKSQNKATLVKGVRVLLDPTRIFKDVNRILPPLERKQLVEILVQWSVQQKKGTVTIEEFPLPQR